MVWGWCDAIQSNDLGLRNHARAGGGGPFVWQTAEFKPAKPQLGIRAGEQPPGPEPLAPRSGRRSGLMMWEHWCGIMMCPELGGR